MAAPAADARSSPPQAAGSRPRTIGAAILASAVAVLPVPLVGGLAVLLREEMGFGEAELGIVIAVFFACAALSAAPAGRAAERIGPRAVARVGLGCIAASMLGVAYVAGDWIGLAAMMALSGVGHALTMLAVGVLLTRAVSERRHGLAFGVAQAAAPLAALLTGLALPTIALTLGWRAGFVLAALIGIVAATVMPRIEARASSTAVASDRDVPTRSLLPLAVAMALASAGGNSAVVFLVPSSVDAGFLAAEAGFVLAIASTVGLLVRVGAGWLGDVMRNGALLLMAILIGVGGAGFAGLAVGTGLAAVVLFATLAFGGGWGWPGLMLLAAARSSPSAPGVAMGVLTLGGLSGAVFGPVTFGTVAAAVSFAAAWLLMAVLAVVAVILIVWSDRMMRRHRRAAGSAAGDGPRLSVPRPDEAPRILR